MRRPAIVAVSMLTLAVAAASSLWLFTRSDPAGEKPEVETALGEKPAAEPQRTDRPEAEPPRSALPRKQVSANAIEKESPEVAIPPPEPLPKPPIPDSVAAIFDESRDIMARMHIAN